MAMRPLLATLVVAAVTAGIVAVRVLPASSGSDGLSPGVVADVVALIHHDQQGIVLAHQAEAQSPDDPTRIRATGLADGFALQARALTTVLDAHRVPIRSRLVDTTHLDVGDPNAMGCDLMPNDAVSNLAASAPVDFDARFTLLMGRHLVGGIRMAAAVHDSGGLTPGQLAAVQRPQRTLA
jgi:Domain of unknown function (DUF305)